MITKTVYKYPVSEFKVSRINLPDKCRIIHGAYVCNAFYIWVELNPQVHKKKPRFFKVYPTGGDIPGRMQVDHVATCIIPDNQEVWHIYEVENH